jgi:hypothetical protein
MSLRRLPRIVLVGDSIIRRAVKFIGALGQGIAHQAQLDVFAWDGYNASMCLQVLRNFKPLHQDTKIIVGDPIDTLYLLTYAGHLPRLQ